MPFAVTVIGVSLTAVVAFGVLGAFAPTWALLGAGLLYTVAVLGWVARGTERS